MLNSDDKWIVSFIYGNIDKIKKDIVFAIDWGKKTACLKINYTSGFQLEWKFATHAVAFCQGFRVVFNW